MTLAWPSPPPIIVKWPLSKDFLQFYNLIIKRFSWVRHNGLRSRVFLTQFQCSFIIVPCLWPFISPVEVKNKIITIDISIISNLVRLSETWKFYLSHGSPYMAGGCSIVYNLSYLNSCAVRVSSLLATFPWKSKPCFWYHFAPGSGFWGKYLRGILRARPPSANCLFLKRKILLFHRCHQDESFQRIFGAVRSHRYWKGERFHSQ